jgi:hypothetical protein
MNISFNFVFFAIVCCILVLYTRFGHSYWLGRTLRSKITNIKQHSATILRCTSKDSPKPHEKAKTETKKKYTDDQAAKTWESGKIFTEDGKAKKKSNSNIAWWMNRDEDNNPLLLPKYYPWWAEKNYLVDSSWKLNQLQEEAKRRGVPSDRKKQQLIDSINDTARKYDLSDEKFVAPTFKKPVIDSLPRCYPEVYTANTSKKSN